MVHERSVSVYTVKTKLSYGTNLHILLEIHDLSLGSDLELASYMVKGPDKNLSVEYGHVGPDGLDQR